MAYWLAAGTLWRREMVRFLRQRNRIIGALGTPLVLWLLLGSGLGGSFRPSGAAADEGYLEYFFPGTLALIVLFTAIFSSISIIEDRQTGFLQSVLVAPVRRSAITLGKVLGGTSLAVLQAIVLLLLAPLAGIPWSLESFLAAAGVLALVAFELSSLGFFMAWKMDSTQGFHAVMNLILMPMWLLSGAFFPAAGAPGWLRAVIAANPLTYGVAGLRHALYLGSETAPANLPGPGLCLAVTAAFAAVAFFATTRVAGRGEP